MQPFYMHNAFYDLFKKATGKYMLFPAQEIDTPSISNQ